MSRPGWAAEGKLTHTSRPQHRRHVSHNNASARSAVHPRRAGISRAAVAPRARTEADCLFAAFVNYAGGARHQSVSWARCSPFANCSPNLPDTVTYIRGSLDNFDRKGRFAKEVCGDSLQRGPGQIGSSRGSPRRGLSRAGSREAIIGRNVRRLQGTHAPCSSPAAGEPGLDGFHRVVAAARAAWRPRCTSSG